MSLKIEKQLLSCLNSFFINKGFDLIFPLRQFRRPTRSGFHNVIIAASGIQPTIIEVNIGTRIDLVEQLAYQFTTGLEAYQQDSNTMVTSVGRIKGQPYFRYELNDSNKLDTISAQIQLFMEEDGFRFLDLYSGTKALDKLYNESPRKKSPFIYNHFNRCIRGVVLAKLADRVDFTALVATYRLTLVKGATAPSMLEKYDRLVDHLKTFSFN